MHKLSIILPSFNHNSFLEDRLNSIINQTFTDWKLIIIDDNSSDNSIQTLKSFSKKYPEKIDKFIINKKNSGSGYKSWQKGIELSKAEYIWIAETDDFSDVDFLTSLINILDKNSNCALAFCNSVYVDINKENLYTSEKRTKSLVIPKNEYGVFEDNVLIKNMPFKPFITNGSAVVFRNPKNILPNELFIHRQCSDIFLWTYLVKDNKFIFLNRKLNFFRRHEESTTFKMNAFHKKNIYNEKIRYLNYFEQQYKFEILLNHYIKHYLIYNKKDFLKYNFLRDIDNVSFIDFKYFLSITSFLYKKIKNAK